MLPFWAMARSQYGQWKGLSPVWVRMCRLKSAWLRNFLWHMMHRFLKMTSFRSLPSSSTYHLGPSSCRENRSLSTTHHRRLSVRSWQVSSLQCMVTCCPQTRVECFRQSLFYINKTLETCKISTNHDKQEISLSITQVQWKRRGSSSRRLAKLLLRTQQPESCHLGPIHQQCTNPLTAPLITSLGALAAHSTH